MARRWKRHELEWARMVDAAAERNPSNGRRQNDIDLLECFAVEHKSRKTPMMFIRKAMHQAVEGARKHGTGQTPIVGVTDGSGKELQRWVVMRLQDAAPLLRREAQRQSRAGRVVTPSPSTNGRSRTHRVRSPGTSKAHAAPATRASTRASAGSTRP